MRANYPSKAVANLKFMGAGPPIDIKVYKKCGAIRGVGLENHLYHEEDAGRIHRVNVCEFCNEEVEAENMLSLADADGKLISFSREEISDMWDAGNEMKVISCPSSDAIYRAIADGTICLKEPYEICAVDVGSEFHLQRLFTAMKTNEQCMSVNVPMNAQLRRGIIFPSGLMYTLFFENEIRESRPAHRQNHGISKEAVLDLLDKLKARKRNVSKAIPKVTPEKVLAGLRGDPTH